MNIEISIIDRRGYSVEFSSVRIITMHTHTHTCFVGDQMINLKYASTKPIRIENEYNEEYDYSDDGGIVYNTDYYEKPRSSTRMHFDDVPPYDNVEETDDAFYSMTDVIYSFPKCKCGQQISIINELIFIRL